MIKYVLIAANLLVQTYCCKFIGANLSPQTLLFIRKKKQERFFLFKTLQKIWFAYFIGKSVSVYLMVLL